MQTSHSPGTPGGEAAKGIYFIAVSQFGIAFSFNMGFVESLPLLLALRLLQGALGGVSTIGLVLITASAPQGKLPNYAPRRKRSGTGVCLR